MIGLRAQADLLFVEADTEFTFSGGPKCPRITKRSHNSTNNGSFGERPVSLASSIIA